MIICVSTYTDRPWKDSEGFFYITSPEVLLHLVNEYFETVKSFLRENNVYDDVLDDLLYADDVTECKEQTDQLIQELTTHIRENVDEVDVDLMRKLNELTFYDFLKRKNTLEVEIEEYFMQYIPDDYVSW